MSLIYSYRLEGGGLLGLGTCGEDYLEGGLRGSVDDGDDLLVGDGFVSLDGDVGLGMLSGEDR